MFFWLSRFHHACFELLSNSTPHPQLIWVMTNEGWVWLKSKSKVPLADGSNFIVISIYEFFLLWVCYSWCWLDTKRKDTERTIPIDFWVVLCKDIFISLPHFVSWNSLHESLFGTLTWMIQRTPFRWRKVYSLYFKCQQICDSLDPWLLLWLLENPCQILRSRYLISLNFAKY